MNQLLSAEARIAGALVEMVRREGSELQTTQEELANYVGVSRVTVGQILRRFAQSNAISLGYRRILVLRSADLSERFRSCR
jgi:CRP/FNR family cyclic AMP-dependent transcriptional regulator